MMRSFYILVLVFSGIVSMLNAQNEKRDCFDMRVGYSNVTIKKQRLISKFVVNKMSKILYLLLGCKGFNIESMY